MAISFVAESHTHNYYASSSLSITKPSGTTNGDVLIAIVGGTRSGGTPSGWTQLGSAASGVGSLGTVYCYYKVASGEGSSYSFPLSGSAWDCWGSVTAYRGVDNTTPVDTTHFEVAADSGTNYTTSSITASGSQWAFTFAMQYTYGAGSGGSWSESSGVERGDTNDFRNSESSSYCVVDSNALVSAGSFSRTQTCSISTSGGVRGALLLNQAGGGTTNASAGAVSASATVVSPDRIDVGIAASAGAAAATASAKAPTPVIGRFATAGAALVAATLPDVQRQARPTAAAVAVEVIDPYPFLGTPVYRTSYVDADARTLDVAEDARLYVIPPDEPLT